MFRGQFKPGAETSTKQISTKKISRGAARAKCSTARGWGACLRKRQSGGLAAHGHRPLASIRAQQDRRHGGAQAGLLATHLAVLRDLHLLPLRHLGDVEVALWDPQQKRDTRKHQKKIKATENKKHSLKFVFVIISEFKRRHYIPNSVRYGVHMA